jgi:Sec-independent protein translocase protein TatA
MVLAVGFLTFGPGELLLVLGLIVLLFGVDAAPRVARELGRWQTRLSQTSSDILRTIEIEQQGLSREQADFERARETHIRSVVTPANTSEPPVPDNVPSGDKPQG